MPALLPLTEALNVTKVIDVVRILNQPRADGRRTTLVDACKRVGISPDTYYRVTEEDPDGLLAFQELFTQTSRQALAQLLTTRILLLQRVIEDGLDPDTSPADRLKIFSAVESQLANLADTLRLDSIDTGAAAEVLGGPNFAMQTSRLSVRATSTEVTVKLEQPDIIDAQPREDRSTEQTDPTLKRLTP